MHIQDVPIEICREIFYLSENPYQCALVCKIWTEHALQIFYNDLTLGFDGLYQTKQELKLNASERDGFFKYANLVKKLTIGENKNRSVAKFPPKKFKETLYISKYDLDQDEFIMLLECLPNLQNLHLSIEASDDYLQYLLETNSEKCMNHIQTITSDRYDIQFSLYYKYRATLTTLRVNDQRAMIRIGLQYGRLLTFLSHFPNMTDLTLINPPSNTTTFDVQKACPRLTSLEYDADFDMHDEVFIKILQNPAAFNLKSNLETLKLTIPFVSMTYVKYLTEFACKQINTFVLDMYDVNLHDWISDIGIENVLKLAKQIGTLKDFGFSCTTGDMYTRRTFSDKTNMTSFFELLNAFKGNKEAYCRIEFCDVEGYSAEDLIEYDAEDGFNLRCKLDYKDYRSPYYGVIQRGHDLYPYAGERVHENENDTHHNIEETEDDHSSGDDIQIEYDVVISLPDTEISIIGPEVINYMHVTMSDRHPDLPYKFLEYALTHCPKLDYFHFGFLKEPAEEFCITTVINPQKLKINHQVLSTNPQKTMKVVKTADFIPSREWLIFVAKCVPNIEFFALGDHNLDSTTPDITEIDLTIFKKLKTLYFLMEVISKGDADRAFIHLKFSDGDESYYCQDCTNPLVLKPATGEDFQRCKNDETIDARCITITCDKHIQIVVFSDEIGTIAEFSNGLKLDYVHIDSNFFRTISIM